MSACYNHTSFHHTYITCSIAFNNLIILAAIMNAYSYLVFSVTVIINGIFKLRIPYVINCKNYNGVKV